MRTVPWSAGLLLVCLALVLSACGGDDGEAESDSNGATTTEAPSGDDGSGDTEAPSDDDGATDDTEAPSNDVSSGEATAVVTIGGETYEADLSVSLSVCISMGGAIGASGPVIGVDGSNMSIDIPPEDWDTSGDDWEPPSIRLDLGEDAEGVPIDWRAGGGNVLDLPELEGKSQVDSYSVSGSSASGEATFIDFFQYQLFQAGQVDEPQPVAGTFSVSCG